MPTMFTAHLSREELACHDGTPYPFAQIDDEDPSGRTWEETRAVRLGDLFEAIRAGCGDLPITVDSAYRTIAYDTKLYDADAGAGNVATPQGSQHPKGRALDLVHSSLTPMQFYNRIMTLFEAGQLPQLGGIGLYRSFVHVDCRQRPGALAANDGHLATWSGTRTMNIV